MTSGALQAYDRLIGAGFDDQQARAILDAMAGDLVTREYLDARLAVLKSELETRIATVHRDLLVAVLGATGVILGSIYFVLPRLVAVTP